MAAFNIKRKEQTLEELLVTDELFCEYFNIFLSLPVFPEPICFNRETNGFEIVTSASKNIAKEIKALLRAAKRRDHIYDVTKLNSYTDLMLLPMEEEVLPDEKEVSTVFAVQTLNKDQGIEWVKACRLAAFLNSDTYHEYRLAVLLSQGRLDPQNADEFSDVHIVSERRRKTTLSSASSGTQAATTATENSVAGDQMESGISSDDDRESDDEALMKEMYVHKGNTSSAETKAWLMQARQAMDEGGAGVASRPSTSVPLLSHTNSSTRPKSAASFAGRLDGQRSGHSTSRSVASTADSGRGSAVDMLDSLLGRSSSTRATSSKSSASTASHQPADSECAVLDSKLIGPVTKVAPRLRFADSHHFDDGQVTSTTRRDEELLTSEPSDAALGNHEGQDHGAGDASGEDAADDSYAFIEEFINEILRQALELYADETAEKQENISNDTGGEEVRDATVTSVVSDAENKNSEVVESEKQTAAVTDMPATTSNVTEKPESSVDVSDESTAIITESSENGTVEGVLQENIECGGLTDVTAEHGHDSENTSTATAADAVSTREEKRKKRISESEENKDKDSLLDSDGEDENSLDGTTSGGGRDLTFARSSSASKKSASSSKIKALSKRRDVMQFRKFLDGTEGEKAWCLWLDVERAKLIRDNTRMMDYFAIMRELYYRSGAPLELCREVKWQLGLAEPADWTILGKFVHAQNRLLESLLVYWVPSYLLQVNGDPLTSNFLYYHQKVLLAPANQYSVNDHKPKPLLPLRPKTCKPSLRPTTTDQTLASQQPATSHAIGQPVRPKTSPAVGVNKIRRTLQSARGQGHMTDVVDAKAKVNTQVSQSSVYGTKKTSHVTKEEDERARLQLLSNQMLADDAGIVMPETEMPRMEGLLQTLDCEGHSGHVFRRYIEKTRNLVCRRCLDFWEELQRYHWLFYRDNFDPELAAKKSKLLHSRFIVIGSEEDIGCDNATRVAINRELNPPFEDLFDMAEDYALQTLYQVWSDMIIADNSNFEKIELIEVSRHLGRTSKYIINMKRRGLVQRVETDGEDEMMLEDCEEPEYDPTLIDKVAPEFRNMTLEKLCRNRVELEHFRQFLADADKLAAIDLACFLDIEAYRCLPHSEEKLRRLKAKDIKKKYLNKKYFFGINSPAGREGQERVVEVGGGWGKFLADVPPTESILEAQKYVRDRLEKHWLLLFMASPEFVERQAPKATVGEAVEDLLIQTRKRQQLITRMLESRWVSESKDLLNFRKALANPVTSLYFRRYVSIKGDCYENDVLFWQEVQRYKELCHMHSDKTLIVQKTSAIVNCFIDSALTPSLQIDITTEMAEKIIDRRYEASPYLFREAQLTVFRILYEHWTPFCQFRTKLTDDKVLPTIERHRRRARAKEQKKKEKETKSHKDDQQDGSRPASGLETEDAENAMTPTATSASPFAGRAATASDDGWEMGAGSRTQVSWSYSQYVKALDRETIIADNDESTLSLLSGATGKDQTIEETGSRKRGVSESKRDDGRSSKKKEVAFADSARKNSITGSSIAPQPKKATSEVVELPPVQRMSSAKGHRRTPADVGQGQAKK